MTDPLVLTVPEAAELLRVSKDVVYARIAEGVIPTVDWLRTGSRNIRIPRQALLELVNGNGSASASGPSLEPGGPPSSGDAGGPDGATGESSAGAVRGVHRAAASDGSSVASIRRPVPQESVDRHPAAAKQEGRAATRPSRTPAAG